MTLGEFCEFVRNNLGTFEKSYHQQREGALRPDIASPLQRTPERWFEELRLWFRLIEVMGGLKENTVDQESSSELELEDFEGENK